MKFFPIVPIRYLSLASVSHNHMVLADYYLRYPKYRKFYLKMRERKDYIILDNSCCELDSSIDLDDLIMVARELKPDILVLPDRNDSKNLELFDRSIYNLKLWWNSKELRQTLGLMTVPHSMKDLEYMMGFKILSVTHVGLNRQMDDLYGRAKIIKEYLNHPIKFHLLGFKKDPVGETKEVLEFDNVTGVDSLLPYRLTRLGRRVVESRPFPPNLDLEEEGKLPPEILKHIKRELTWFINWVETKPVGGV